ncbi:MAG TPA: DNA-directed RNA polymerase subunit alpha C-terminal domain-containing protein [Patescibacteria group bacterium]|nr:DNA-directed RNA polymerase subunit alpha C-terminal domain-containing protein [Patescibacteria group bacterium]
MKSEVDEQADALSPLNVDIAEINLNTRAMNALKSAGVETTGQILDRLEQGGEDALLSITGVGQKALIDIRKYLRAQGLIE